MTGFQDIISPYQLVRAMLDMSESMDRFTVEYREAMFVEAEAEETYRTLRAVKWQAAESVLGLKANVGQKQAWVDGDCAAARRSRDEAIGHTKACFERVRNTRQKLSALQSAANAIKEEAAFARTGPDTTGA